MRGHSCSSVFVQQFPKLRRRELVGMELGARAQLLAYNVGLGLPVSRKSFGFFLWHLAEAIPVVSTCLIR